MICETTVWFEEEKVSEAIYKWIPKFWFYDMRKSWFNRGGDPGLGGSYMYKWFFFLENFNL